MDKETTKIVEELGVTLKTEEDADKLIATLKNKLKFYQNKNEENEQWISKLKLAPSELKTETQNIIKNLADIAEKSSVDSLDVSDVGLSLLDTLEEKYKINKQLDSLKEKQGHYIKLIEQLKQENDTLLEETRIVQEQVNQIDSVPSIEINSLEAIVKKYRKTVDDLLEKNQWINKEEYNSLSIQEELKKLHKLRNKAETLRSEVGVYSGLQPDLDLARKQLSDTKKEYEALRNEYRKSTK